jgi:alpha-beta hydrolase superfamily lysophospholipase
MPDYSGLGVSVDGAEKPIVHEYLASPAAAKDLEYGLKAAQEAFPLVGKKFVVLGHSQGGAVAWSFAERMYEFPMDGYLGVVPMAPVTRLLDESDHMRPVLAAGALWGMENIFPEFDMNTILTPDGVERMKADKALGGNVAVTGALFFGADLFKPGWETNEYVQRFQELTHAGGKGFRGPMLLLQGLSDPLISHSVTSEAAKRTADICPKASIKYVQYHDISHVPTAYVSQRLWLDWIKSRFDDEPVEPGLVEEHMESLLPAESYVPETNWFLALGVKYYETP